MKKLPQTSEICSTALMAQSVKNKKVPVTIPDRYLSIPHPSPPVRWFSIKGFPILLSHSDIILYICSTNIP